MTKIRRKEPVSGISIRFPDGTAASLHVYGTLTLAGIERIESYLDLVVASIDEDAEAARLSEKAP